MSDSKNGLETIGCCCVLRCGQAQVAIRQDVAEDFSQLEQRHRDRFHRIMELWCEGKSLTPEMMNRNEGRSKGNQRVEAFKAFKVRLYGFEITFKNIRTFFIVIIDSAKKQKKADKNILKTAKSRADELSGDIDND